MSQLTGHACYAICWCYARALTVPVVHDLEQGWHTDFRWWTTIIAINGTITLTVILWHSGMTQSVFACDWLYHATPVCMEISRTEDSAPTYIRADITDIWKCIRGLMWPAGCMLDIPVLDAKSWLNGHKQRHACPDLFLTTFFEKQKNKKKTPMSFRLYIWICVTVLLWGWRSCSVAVTVTAKGALSASTASCRGWRYCLSWGTNKALELNTSLAIHTISVKVVSYALYNHSDIECRIWANRPQHWLCSKTKCH